METKNETPKKEAGIVQKMYSKKLGIFNAFEHAGGHIHAWLHDVVKVEQKSFVLDDGTTGITYEFTGRNGEYHMLTVFEHKED